MRNGRNGKLRGRKRGTGRGEGAGGEGERGKDLGERRKGERMGVGEREWGKGR